MSAAFVGPKGGDLPNPGPQAARRVGYEPPPWSHFFFLSLAFNGHFPQGAGRARGPPRASAETRFGGAEEGARLAASVSRQPRPLRLPAQLPRRVQNLQQQSCGELKEEIKRWNAVDASPKPTASNGKLRRCLENPTSKTKGNFVFYIETLKRKAVGFR